MGDQGSTTKLERWNDRLTVGFATVGFLGYAPVASGTVGSIPAVGVALLLRDAPEALFVLAVVLFVLGTAASSRTEELLGGKDPGEIIIDEFVGMLVAYLWLPMSWISVVVVFLLFRVFDILKPFPARRAERVKGGFGIMADDVIAGIYANLAFRVFLLLFS